MFECGIKIYDYAWIKDYDLTPEETAKLIKDWGFNFVLSKTKFLNTPAPGNLNDQELCTLDLRFREALQAEGLEYWITSTLFYNKQAIKNNPSLIPVGSDGKPMEQEDWYIGINPANEEFVEDQSRIISSAVEALNPEGIFLSFTRWPGFWECWVPERSRTDFPEYSYDPATLSQFHQDTGIVVPSMAPECAASWIDANVREEWTQWKCKKIADIIYKIKSNCQNSRPDIQIMLNTLPFRSQEFSDARREVFGQDVERLAEFVDIFEVMTYHQILKQDIDWIKEAGLEVKTSTRKKTFCTIQAKAIYTNGYFANDNRSKTIDNNEFSRAISTIQHAGMDGIVVFTFTDLLNETIRDGNSNRVQSIIELAGQDQPNEKQKREIY